MRVGVCVCGCHKIDAETIASLYTDPSFWKYSNAFSQAGQGNSYRSLPFV